MKQPVVKYYLITASSVCGLLVLTTLIYTNEAYFYKIDHTFFQHNAAKPIVAAIFIYLAKTATIIPMLGFFAIISYLAWKNHYFLLAWWNMGNVFAVSAIGYLLKNIIQRTRPDLQQLVDKTSYSFPSGHSLLAMIFCCSSIAVLSTVFTKNNSFIIGFKILLILYVIAIGASRIYLRVHYPTDVIAGYLLSLSWFFFAYGFFKDKLKIVT